MRILIKLYNMSEEEWYLVSFYNSKAIKEIEKHINKNKYKKAIMFAILRGDLLQQIPINQVFDIEADLILTMKNARFVNV